MGPAAKPAGAPCPHLNQSGCGVYPDRPAVCSRFRCAWLANRAWPETWRPDKSGLLCLRETLPDGTPGSLVLESRAGALLEAPAKEILLALMRVCATVVVAGPDGRLRLMRGCWQHDSGDDAQSHRIAA